jgi:hypothetical protein
MGRLRWSLNVLKRDARENLDSFILEDGSRFYFDPSSAELFLHAVGCLAAQGDGVDFPQPPETLKAVARARHREAALNQVLGGASFVLFPYEHEALVEHGTLVPRSLVAGHELGEGPLPDLSE